MPTRIAPFTATLIDHIYFYPGSHNSKNITLKSGNILSDVTDHLPNYTLITSKKVKFECRPYVCIFSQKNKLNFLKYLQACDWNQIYQDDDVNTVNLLVLLHLHLITVLSLLNCHGREVEINHGLLLL